MSGQNNSSPRGGNPLANGPEEEIVLIQVAAIALGAVLGSAGLLWMKGVEWLVEHQVLVSAEASPLLEIPGTEGAGLDVSRVVIATSLLLGVLAIAISSGRRLAARRRQERMG